jgi:hypothetical protein
VKKWLSGTRGTVLLILMWAMGWGVGFGGLIEAFVDPNGELVDIWPAAMAIPGFIGGAVMCALLRVAEGHRSLEEVSIARFATWGVVTGFVLGVLAVAIGLPNDIAIDTPQQRPVAPTVLVSITTALAAVAAIISALFFRLVAQQENSAMARPNV